MKGFILFRVADAEAAPKFSTSETKPNDSLHSFSFAKIFLQHKARRIKICDPMWQ